MKDKKEQIGALNLTVGQWVQFCIDEDKKSTLTEYDTQLFSQPTILRR